MLPGCCTVGGYPNIATAEEHRIYLLNNELGIIEITSSYAAPIADGPIIQGASHRHLLKGFTHDLSW